MPKASRLYEVRKKNMREWEALMRRHHREEDAILRKFDRREQSVLAGVPKELPRRRIAK